MVVAAFGGFALTACFPPPPQPQACQSVSPNAEKAAATVPPSDVSSVPLTPEEAAARARQIIEAVRGQVASGAIGLSLVIRQGSEPRFLSASVSTPDDAARAAQQAAQQGGLVAVDVARPVHATATGPDSLRPQQWALDQVPFETAWTTGGTKGSGVKVAVVDTGVKADHEDLSGQVLSGEHFLHSNDGGTAFSGPGGTADDNGHGTHVSGIIDAINNNALGITGAAPETKILPVKVLCANGSGFDVDVAQGISWAADNGAKVINLSLGGPGNSAALQAAVQHAEDQNVVVVAAAGNCGGSSFAANGCSFQNQTQYPGGYSAGAKSPASGNVIAVAATINSNPPGHASYSTVASYVDLAAPGGSGCGSGSSCDVLSTWNDGGYQSIAGTSMATPYVSAAAALVRAKFASCSADHVRTDLLATATPLTPNTNNQFGAGLVNPVAAIAACV